MLLLPLSLPPQSPPLVAVNGLLLDPSLPLRPHLPSLPSPRTRDLDKYRTVYVKMVSSDLSSGLNMCGGCSGEAVEQECELREGCKDVKRGWRVARAIPQEGSRTSMRRQWDMGHAPDEGEVRLVHAVGAGAGCLRWEGNDQAAQPWSTAHDTPPTSPDRHHTTPCTSQSHLGHRTRTLDVWLSSSMGG